MFDVENAAGQVEGLIPVLYLLAVLLALVQGHLNTHSVVL